MGRAFLWLKIDCGALRTREDKSQVAIPRGILGKKKMGHRMRKTPSLTGVFLSFATKRSWIVLDVYVMQLYHDMS